MMDIRLGNSLDVLKEYNDNFFDSCVTDPPYGLGKEPDPLIVLRDWLDKGFSTVRGRGFLNQEWDSFVPQPILWKEVFRVLKPGAHLLSFSGTRTHDWMAMSLRLAGFEIRDSISWIYGQGFPHGLDIGKSIKDLEGWNTVLKPASELIILARKPISEPTIVDNVRKWGTGGINIDDSRIKGSPVPVNILEKWSGFGEKICPNYTKTINTKGRYPSNVILDDAVGELLGEESKFFYCAKPTVEEKNRYLEKNRARLVTSPRKNHHPTVKPIELIRYLVRLITPKSGNVLDPFLGSGTTGCVCRELKLSFTGIELFEEYYNISVERILNWPSD